MQNVTFNANHTVTFSPKRTPVFVPEMSIGSLDDVLMVPNIPLLVSKFLMLYLKNVNFDNK